MSIWWIILIAIICGALYLGWLVIKATAEGWLMGMATIAEMERELPTGIHDLIVGDLFAPPRIKRNQKIHDDKEVVDVDFEVVD